MKSLPLLNRASFDEALEQLNRQQPLTVGLMDLDNFQSVNDQLGHDVGDKVLRFVERVLTGSLPGDSLVARIGGDEYALALPDTSTETALILLNEVTGHFRDSIGSLDVPRSLGLGLSVGLAQRPAHAQTPAELLRAADEALLRAKREGRGRIAIYVESKMVLKSNYYPKASLERLAKLSTALGRTEASLLREALDELIDKHRESL
ncbi:GGDEF domain-containing protein [Deinococcus peraridilitoris]|uniref:Diguanylate cyclase (GGDEF) domain-containing protein n=1 Tax=Deinococcus peraridilitoris (strain DSM 19664 / LMG 22246 / CIP 109416 / KR-200) TaxID=937777 RepID=L0A2T6_DEIPD|nr:GGDEF domain-containing protein [Deinococcus peraridilitoris]AFZ68141.1 diguanylate cyclase (GGDEF) domain-containing protein [Deinococcus peraridilitoris DSM 19664]